MSGESMRGWAKRIEARIALALSRAQAAGGGVAILLARSANHQALVNGAPIGPANHITFASNPFVAVSGKVRVQVYANVTGTGGTLVAGDQVLIGIARDGLIPIGGRGSVVLGTAAASNFELSYGFDDIVTPGSSHTWNIDLQANNGHTMSLLAADGSILIEEQG